MVNKTKSNAKFRILEARVQLRDLRTTVCDEDLFILNEVDYVARRRAVKQFAVITDVRKLRRATATLAQ
jgi:hypothetical protein